MKGCAAALVAGIMWTPDWVQPSITGNPEHLRPYISTAYTLALLIQQAPSWLRKADIKRFYMLS